ncbi:MAG: heme o synthase [Planctomycetota bacterium]
MNTTAIAAAIRARSTTPSVARLRDFVELTKPRLSFMVLITVAVAMLVCDAGSVSLLTLAAVVGSTGLVAASACVWNQIAERRIDAKMGRTADRPLPAGRVSVTEASCFSIVSLVLGCGGLTVSGGIWSAGLGLLTWLIYVVIYTPMKQRSAWNTFYGAIAGALPVLIGWSATAAPLDSISLAKGMAIFTVVFLWQFPHFMAIAWKYRDDYANASLRMASVVEPTGRLSGRIAIVAAAALLPVTASLAFVGSFTPLYLGLVTFLGVWQLSLAVRFARARTAHSARVLLRASLVYLPLLLLCITCIPIL